MSQFEQHIRAIAGWPLGKPVRHGPVTMINLIGNDVNSYERWLAVPGATCISTARASRAPAARWATSPK